MYSKSPPNRMKRPHEASGMVERPQKSRPVVVADDGAVEDEVSLMTPPVKLNKRPREETPRKSLFGVVRVKDEGFEKKNVFRFRVLLPNGTAVELKMSELRNEIRIEDFIDMVEKEYSLLVNQKTSLGQKREINWQYQDLHFTDVKDNKIRIKLDFSKFSPNNWHLLVLHDGSLQPDEYEDMWDLTPDTDLLKELPDDYTCETALADLIDNSLQALWSNGAGEARLISLEMEPGKISIFDSGPGMDGANGNIVKWGKMGASLHRSVREKAIGCEPPYLMPFFGMFGYGGPVATMCLGRRAVVSSKTKGCNKVYTLHMERDALVSASHTENCWKTKGGVRDPLKDEEEKSPHGSFTKVEIFDPKSKVKNLYIRHLRRKLKDIYFPYVQCDEMSGKTSRPIVFQVNGIDLVGIQGGEVAITNTHSCNGPNFVVQLKLWITLCSSSMSGQNQRVSATANASLKFVYFPIVKGTENIQRILDKLNEDNCEIKESFESFSRVSVRRLGRLLPETRWGLLPFMELKQKKGEKAQSLKRHYSRVKCFVDTDAGFNPTPHKTDLAHQHPYTKALKNFGNVSLGDEKEVQVEISKDGKKLTLAQLEKLYHEWIAEMHDRYDEEDTDCGLDEPIIVIVSSKVKKLDLTSGVLRVHKKIQRKERVWEAGMNIKVLKGACAGCHKNNVYATLEYIILEGLKEDASGEARLICRPLGVPEKRGCCLLVEEGNKTIAINDSCLFPLRIIDSEQCLPVDDIEWGTRLQTFNQKLPASIDLLSLTDCQELEIDGDHGVLPISLEAGDRLPEKIIAVIRPKSFHNGNSSTSKRLHQKSIVRDNHEMVLNVRRKASDGNFQHVFSGRCSASSLKELHGLYIFSLSTKQLPLLEEPGIVIFSFSLIEFKNIELEHKVQVRASAGVGRWELLNHDKNESYTVRVGSCFRPISIACYDGYQKRIRFKSVPKLVIKLNSSGRTIGQVHHEKVEITLDKLTMKIKDIFIKSSELDDIRPNYEATLCISTPDEAFSVALPCQVIPSALKKVTVYPTELRKQLLPGQTIEELALEVFDEYGNHLKENEIILLRLDGLSIQDGSGVTCGVITESKKKVDANGRVDLSNLLKVSRGYGKRVMLSVMSKDEVIFKLQFQTEMRELRAEQKVFMNCGAGSLLKNVTFEIIDSEGEVDERIHDEDKHGQSHTLAIKCKSFRDAESVKCRFRYGRCTVPSIPLAHTEGVVFFEAMHSRYPELKCVIKVYVEKPRQQHCDSVTNYEDVGNHMHQPKCLSENEPITQSRNSDVLQSKMAAQVSNSALIAQKVHHEKQQKEKLGSTMNQRNLPVSPSPRSSEHQRNLPVSPSSNVSQGMNKTISPHCSGNTILATPSSSKRKQILPISPSSRVSQEMNQTFTPLSSGNPVLSTPRSPEQGLLPVSPSLKASQGMNKTISSHSSGNPMPSTPSSSEHKQILPISPSSRVSQEMNRTFTPPSSGNPVLSTPRSPEQGLLPVSPSLNKTLCLHSSKGFLSPISDSSALKTPKSEHTPALGGTSVILCSKENPSEQELEDDLTNSAKQASSHERNLEIIQSSLLQIQIEISQLQALIDSNPGNNVLHATLEQIQSQSQSAASVICKMPEEELTRQGIVGVASLLGTVESIELSRMLAQYLGEDQMLAIACRNYAAAQSLEVNILHKFAGYNAFCLEDIRPRSKEPSTDPKDPTLRDGNVPHGFLGYAVNLISIAPSHIRWRTTSGHGLRETLFYRLFGELQVYKDRDCMMAAQSCIQTGAVSLDGVILRGNGLISLGLREPKILFSVMRRSTSPEGKLAAKELEVANMQQRMVEEEDAFRRSTQKFLICRDKYNRYMSQKGAE